MSDGVENPDPLSGIEINIKTMARSLTGFDEIAIRKAFREPFENLTGMFAVRSLLFIHLRRNGYADKDAHGVAMNATVGQLSDMSVKSDEGEDGGEDGGNGQSPTELTL